MRITLVMAGDEEGGLEKHVVELANGLAEGGEQVSVVAHSKYRDRLDTEIQFQAVDLSKSRRNPLVLWQLYKAIKSTTPDIVHVHGNKAAAMVAPLLSWLNLPSVATLHALKKNLNSFLAYDRVIAVSRRVVGHFSQPEKVRVIFNGINPPPQRFEKKLWQTAYIQAIAIGRLVDVKGFDVLVDAWQGINASLWIVGDGPDQTILQQKIKALNLQDRISLLGYREDISSLIADADFLVISSRKEGGPYTLAEALLVQRPVLSTDVGMVADVLPADFICPPGNATALHQLIRTHLEQPEYLQSSFQPIYQRAKQELSFNHMLESIRKVYNELLAP